MRFRVLISLFWLALLDSHTAHGQRPDGAPPIAPESISIMTAAIHHDLAPLDTARARWIAAVRGDSGTSRADEAFLRAYSATYIPGSSVSQTTRSALALIAGLSPTNPVFKTLRATFAAHGVWLHFLEGEADPEISDSTLRAAARRFLTPPMQQFLDLRMTEQFDPIGGDGAISAPLGVVGRRLAEADRILAAWPGFAASGQLEWRRRQYLSALLGGADNSPAFGLHGVMKPAVRKALERFVQAHPTTESGKAVAGFLQLAASSGWRRSRRTDAFVRGIWSGCTSSNCPRPQ